jgi:hypothetical protein
MSLEVRVVAFSPNSEARSPSAEVESQRGDAHSRGVRRLRVLLESVAATPAQRALVERRSDDAGRRAFKTLHPKEEHIR